jgi:lipopolysaccharide export LptBFGC system permease protein LptF
MTVLPDLESRLPVGSSAKITAGLHTALFYWLLSLLSAALANPIVYNAVYATTVFGVGACIVGQVGGWLSKKNPEDGRLSELLWRYGPTVLLALLCMLYLWADYLQSFH